ncbi:hypothetical protein NHX12_020717 [Muraenolepis orangiensis]|uniref:CCR4-NOT transcription complex subunit 4 n=1 Tax=Muraenolepis orangiensis TaxID=630683 RepID=A0A9Q0ESG9_9TELE|nr:hypothetical protein NHX12_020717 [Muraenolepis orangiensis]
MSSSPDMKEDYRDMECPLCMEALEIDDVNFFPCTCGYQICRFCWHRIRTDENGLCPACRKPYPEDPAVYKPLSQEELQKIKSEKKQRQSEKRQKLTENRKHLASVRVVQRNLVFVVGLSQRLAEPEVLKRPEYFGKFGKIHKVVINNSTSYAGSQGPSASAYVTYIRSDDALRAIQSVNNVVVDGRTLKASLGTTKYCSYFLKSMQCPKPDCMYLHELGDEAASFTKEEMQAGKHQDKSVSLQRSNSTNNTDMWPSLQPPDQMAGGLLSSEPGKSPSPDSSSDSDHMTPEEGLDSDLGLASFAGLSSHFPSSCDRASPSDKLPDVISISNSDTSQLLTCSDSPSPPPGLSKPNLVMPISGLMVRSPFEGSSAESQSLFSDNSNFRHPNPVPSNMPGTGSPQDSTEWPTAPEPHSLFASDTMPVSSSTDWQAAFGFGSSFSFPPWLAPAGAGGTMAAGVPRNHFAHMNLAVGMTLAPSALESSFLDLPTPRLHSTGLGGISISPEHNGSDEGLNLKEWQDGLRALLPNININFGGCWENTASWMDPAIITGIPSANTANGLDSLHDDNPPHWLKSLQALTEMDTPSGPTLTASSAAPASPTTTTSNALHHQHSAHFSSHIPLHRLGWGPYPPLPPGIPAGGPFHAGPPPGFQTPAFRPPVQSQTELLQSAAMDRH